MAEPDPDFEPPRTVAVGDSLMQALKSAFGELQLGHHAEARGLAQSVLIAARSTSDPILEARALSCLAQIDALTHRLRRAAETARRAAQLFQQTGQIRDETIALNTLSHACLLLGRTDEAIESALLSVALCDPLSPTLASVVAHDCLGLAQCGKGHFDRAASSLASSLHLAARCTPPANAYQPTVTRLWIEGLRVADARYQIGALGSLQQMDDLIRECQRLESTGVHQMLVAGLVPLARTVSTSMKGLYATWRGELQHAHTYAERALGTLGGTVTWLDALVRWVVAELAWAEQDWPAAEAALGEMQRLAVGVENEQLACLAHLLLAQVYEQQGLHEAAHEALRAMRARERRIAAESLSVREAAVRWQLGARQSERHLEQALEASRRFERWSLEDPLTGMLNRRAFEQSLAERLPAAVEDGRPLSIAMVDIDRFKSVNDNYSHHVGDKVLQAVATVLMTSVRGHDIAARLGGDEFVLLIGDAAESEAIEICQRIGTAVAEHDWASIAPGLTVSVSIGVSQAVEGDTIESIVHRSDASMYRVKPGWAPTASVDLGL